ncbi:DUF7486 family protein [Winogradskyella sp.]|uniref:DUF7486 family protein n=1 Tax=Winogradskyella sp. TaxID=1883156 RepID=UPI003BADB3B3
MKRFNTLLNPSIILSLALILVFGLAYGHAQELDIDKSETHKPETELPLDVLWDVKAYMPEAKLIKIKAVDDDGTLHAVKALQSYGDTSVLDVKCLYRDEILPVKLVVSPDDKSHALKAIKKDGTALDVKAITDEGEQFIIKGMTRIGNVVTIRVMGSNGNTYKIFAISPEGHVNDVKGIKMMSSKEETVVNGVSIYAHVKALTQI